MKDATVCGGTSHRRHECVGGRASVGKEILWRDIHVYD